MDGFIINSLFSSGSNEPNSSITFRLILLVLFLLSRIARAVNASSREAPPRSVPAVVSGLDIRPESLPDDVIAAARSLWQQGQYREALSLVYRATVSSLVHQHEVDLGEGATEGDVLQASQKKLHLEAQNLLKQITRAWQTIAYAHRQPEEQLAQLVFDHWQQYFGQQDHPYPEGHGS